jgi:hypothetical protein
MAGNPTDGCVCGLDVRRSQPARRIISKLKDVLGKVVWLEIPAGRAVLPSELKQYNDI